MPPHDERGSDLFICTTKKPVAYKRTPSNQPLIFAVGALLFLFSILSPLVHSRSDAFALACNPSGCRMEYLRADRDAGYFPTLPLPRLNITSLVHFRHHARDIPNFYPRWPTKFLQIFRIFVQSLSRWENR